jgi:hypothetical protein
MTKNMRTADEPEHVEDSYIQAMEGDEGKQLENVPENEKWASTQYDEEWVKAQKRYLRKLDYILLPAVSLLYFFEYLDRGNIANAKLYGLDDGHDTDGQGAGPGTKTLTPSQWQLVVMIFYVGLILFQVPGCIGYRVFSPSKV